MLGSHRVKGCSVGQKPGHPRGLLAVACAHATTARADELSAAELREGADILTAKAAEYRPAWIAIVGITAYRTAFRGVTTTHA